MYFKQPDSLCLNEQLFCYWIWKSSYRKWKTTSQLVLLTGVEGSMFQQLRIHLWSWTARVQTLALDTCSITLEIPMTSLCLIFPICKIKINLSPPPYFLWQVNELSHVKHLEECLPEKGYKIHSFLSLKYNIYMVNAQILSVQFDEFGQTDAPVWLSSQSRWSMFPWFQKVPWESTRPSQKSRIFFSPSQDWFR